MIPTSNSTSDGFTVTRDGADLVVPPREGGLYRYGNGFPFQAGPTTAGVFANIRFGDFTVGDFEAGMDAVLFDDHGKTWRTGGVLEEGSDEVAVVQTGDDEIYISYRMNSRATGQRHFARSRDGGESVHEQGEHADLACRGLYAGRISVRLHQHNCVFCFESLCEGVSIVQVLAEYGLETERDALRNARMRIEEVRKSDFRNRGPGCGN